AVDGHAAVPDLEWIPRVLRRPEAEAVDEYITQAAPENAAHHAEEDEIVHVHGLPGRARPGGAVTPQQPSGAEPEQVHDAVPVHLDRTQPKGDRVDVRVVDHARRSLADLGRHAAEERLQVACFRDGGMHRVIGRLAAGLQDLHEAAGVTGGRLNGRYQLFGREVVGARA